MSTRDKLLGAFHGRSQELISGARLARRLGLSRASVWKQIKALQKEGFPVESVERAGYRWRGAADLSLAFFKPPKTGASRGMAHYHLSASSTQDLAKLGAAQGLPEGHLWLAEIQKAGRGRLGRRWDSGFGGLWFSLLIRPAVPPAQIPGLALVCAWTLARTVRKMTGADVRLKWPNDLVVLHQGRWKKAAGILTDMSAEVDRTHWVVLGIGVNVHNPLTGPLGSIAVSLQSLCSRPIERASLLARFLKNFYASYRTFQKDGFERFRAPYWKLYRAPDGWVRLRTSQGALAGWARGIDGSGALIIESRRETHHLTEGEIVL